MYTKIVSYLSGTPSGSFPSGPFPFSSESKYAVKVVSSKYCFDFRILMSDVGSFVSVSVQYSNALPSFAVAVAPSGLIGVFSVKFPSMSLKVCTSSVVTLTVPFVKSALSYLKIV